MDLDLSHSPSDIPRLLAASDDTEVVVGSRFVEANSLEGWAWTRKLMTHLGHWATTVFLRLPQDCTNAFRVYRLDRIPADFFETVQSTSYSFFLESHHRLNINGFSISQIAIRLPPRTYGHSKMRLKDIVYSALLICRLGWHTRLGRIRPIHATSLADRDAGEEARPGQGVDGRSAIADRTASQHGGSRTSSRPR